MAPDFWSIGCTLARTEVALLLSMAQAANGCAQATVRYGRGAGRQALGLPGRANQTDQSGIDTSALEGYCAYLRELAGVAQVSAMTFVEALEVLQGPVVSKPEGFRAGVAEAEAAQVRERAGRTRRPARKGAASREFLLY
jgi:hypothetical protein